MPTTLTKSNKALKIERFLLETFLNRLCTAIDYLMLHYLIASGPQTYIVSLDWTKICGPNWQLFYSTAEKQQKMC